MGGKKGFTLIELLVVVLIIGILAAIALPQYQRAVGRSRVAEAKLTLKAYAGALQRYWMESGTPNVGVTTASLDIDLPVSSNWQAPWFSAVGSGGNVYPAVVIQSKWTGSNVLIAYRMDINQFACTVDNPSSSPSDPSVVCPGMGFTKASSVVEDYCVTSTACYLE